MRAILSLASFVVLATLQGPALAGAGGAEAEVNVTDVPETLPDTQATAQTADDAAQQPAASGESSSDGLLDDAQLDQLVAPIALYPDPLLAQVLVASTYPLEVVQAERWREANADVTGEALTKALEDKDWDKSIKALVAVPDALGMMSKDLDWTAKLGDAVLAQQADVMEAVQRMRGLAYENGKLESNDQQTVTVKQEVNVEQAAPPEASGGQAAPPPQQVIVIEPTSPETVYVPYYQPSVVYGTWPYPSYPPYYFPPPPGYAFGGALARGLAWSAGFAIGNAIWGDGFNWGRNDINVNVNRNVDFSPNANFNKNVNVSNWQHNADHRRGVNYNNKNVSNKFDKSNLANKRQDFRGREPGNKRPGDKRPGDKRPGDKRPSVGDMESALKRSEGAAKRPGGAKPDLANRRPEGGAKRPGGKAPGAGDKRANLQKPGGAKRPDVKKPAAGAKRPDVKKPAAGAKRPDVKRPAAKPAVKKPAARKPSGNAFHKGSGSKARSYSNRGRSSVGHRSASRVSRPSGGHRGGGRGGGRRR